MKVTTKRPLIRVPNIKVVNKDGKRYFEEDYGNYGSFELNPRTKTGDLIVRVVTPSTLNNNSIALSKNRNNEFTTNLLRLSQIYGPEVVAEQAPFDETRRMTKQDFGYGDRMMPQTNLDINKKKQLDMIEQVKQLAGLTLNPANAQPNTNPQGQTPTAPAEVAGPAAPGGQVPGPQGTPNANPAAVL